MEKPETPLAGASLDTALHNHFRVLRDTRQLRGASAQQAMLVVLKQEFPTATTETLQQFMRSYGEK